MVDTDFGGAVSYRMGGGSEDERAPEDIIFGETEQYNEDGPKGFDPNNRDRGSKVRNRKFSGSRGAKELDHPRFSIGSPTNHDKNTDSIEMKNMKNNTDNSG